VPLIRVNDPDDPRIDAYRNVPDPDLLIQGGLFVAEGRLVVRRLIEGRRFPVRSVMVTETALVPLRDVLATRDELIVYLVPQAVMNSITGFNLHRGCLAIGERPRLASGATSSGRVERSRSADRQCRQCWLGVQNAAAFGVNAVLLDRTCADRSIGKRFAPRWARQVCRLPSRPVAGALSQLARTDGRYSATPAASLPTAARDRSRNSFTSGRRRRPA
jgi:hypothetical protein